MAAYDSPADTSPIHAALRSLAQSLEVLHSNVDVLLGNLEPVMGPPAPEAGGMGSPATGSRGSSKLLEEILNLESQVVAIKVQITSANSRLEI